MILAAGLFFLLGNLVFISAMLLVFGMALFDDEIPSRIAVALPVDSEPIGDPIDADYRRLPL